jgi:RNA recognition motif-containing protein
LPWSLAEGDIRELCEPFGEIVDANLITDQRTGRSKGFAFVEFATEEAAAAAIEELNEKETDGRNLFVKVAQPKKPRRDFGGGGYGGNRGGGRRDDNRGGYNRGGYSNDNDNYRG